MTAVQASRLTLAFSYAKHDLCDMLRQLRSSCAPGLYLLHLEKCNRH